MLATISGHTEVVKELLNAGAEVDAADFDDGWTALMRAVIMGNLPTMQALEDKGASLTRADYVRAHACLVVVVVALYARTYPPPLSLSTTPLLCGR